MFLTHNSLFPLKHYICRIKRQGHEIKVTERSSGWNQCLFKEHFDQNLTEWRETGMDYFNLTASVFCYKCNTKRRLTSLHRLLIDSFDGVWRNDITRLNYKWQKAFRIIMEKSFLKKGGMLPTHVNVYDHVIMSSYLTGTTGETKKIIATAPNL